MKSNEYTELDIYLKTGNKHWNAYVLNIIEDAIKRGLFENLILPVKMFNDSIELLIAKNENPLLAVRSLENLVSEKKLKPRQSLFIYEWIYKFLKNTEFKGVDMQTIIQLINGHKERMRSQIQPEKPITLNLRDSLKEFIQKELQTLPETFKGLESKDRLNILCKLMPFVLPKVESIEHSEGER